MKSNLIEEKSKFNVGDIYWWNPVFDKYGHVQGGQRPVIILHSEENSPVATVIPMTTKIKGTSKYYCPIVFNNSVGIALVNQITTVDKEELENEKGSLTDYQLGVLRSLIQDYLIWDC